MLNPKFDKKKYFFLSLIFFISFFLIYSSGERTAFYNFAIFSVLFLIYFYRIIIFLFSLFLILFLLIFLNTSEIKFSRMFLQPFNGLEITAKDNNFKFTNYEYKNDIDYINSNKINIFNKIFFLIKLIIDFILHLKNLLR